MAAAGRGRLGLDGLYEGLAAEGLGYGPVFQGLRAAWRRGDGDLRRGRAAGDAAAARARSGLHPALLDAALHAARLGELAVAADRCVPFAWAGVALHAAARRQLRVAAGAAGCRELALAAADAAGQPVGLHAVRRTGCGRYRPRQRAPWSAGRPDSLYPPGLELRGGRAGLPGPLAVAAGGAGARRACWTWPAPLPRAAVDAAARPSVAAGAGRGAGVAGRTNVTRATRLVVVTRGAVGLAGEAGDGPGRRRRSGGWSGRRSRRTRAGSCWPTCRRPRPGAAQLPWPACWASRSHRPRAASSARRRGWRRRPGAARARAGRGGRDGADHRRDRGAGRAGGPASGRGAWGAASAAGQPAAARPRPGRRELAAELAGLGAEVRSWPCDVADREALAAAAWLGRVPAERGGARGRGAR